MKIQNLRDSFVVKLQALYDIETQITKALPDLVGGASSQELKKVFSEHLDETKEHVNRIEKIFGIIGEKPSKLKTEAIRGLALDAAWVIKQKGEPAAKDASLIAAAQYVEHYEMAGYGSLLSWAKVLNMVAEVEDIITMTLDEEKGADQKLTKLSATINDEANTKMVG